MCGLLTDHPGGHAVPRDNLGPGLFGMDHEELLHMGLHFWQAEPAFKYGPISWKTHPLQTLFKFI